MTAEKKIAHTSLAAFLEDFSEQRRVHAKSLISTFFGDLAMPLGGKAWVETIATVLEPLEINNRSVRTSLFRLSEENWLFSTRSGRKSYYQLTELAKSQTSLAEKIIYSPRSTEWDGVWTIVFLVMKPIDKPVRLQLEQELSWLGFGVVSKHVWAHPCVSSDEISERVRELNLSDQVICMRCTNVQDTLGFNVGDCDMAAQCLPVDEVKEKYQQYVDLFSCLENNLESLMQQASSSQLLCLRLLVIDEYRRIVLQDPHLPEVLLPSQWPGDRAYSLCRKIYLQTKDAADDYYCELMHKAGDVLLTGYQSEYAGRFN